MSALDDSLTDPGFIAAHAFVMDYETAMQLPDDVESAPKIHVLSVKDGIIRPIEFCLVDPRMTESGDTKDRLAKIIRSKRADYPKCMVIYSAEVWIKLIKQPDELDRVLRDGVSGEPDKTSGFMLAIYRGKDKVVVVHEIVLNPRRFGPMKVTEKFEGRFA